MANPSQKIHLGLKILKYKTPEKLINILNDLIDKNLKEEKLKPHGRRLVGEIKQEWNVYKILPTNLLSFFRDCTINYIKNELTLLKGKKLSGCFNSCWINDQIEREYNPAHTHYGESPLGLSSVLFLKVPKSVSEAKQTLNKDEPVKDGRLEFIAYTKTFMGENQYLVTPQVGDLYLFPYELPHLVYPFKGEGVRRSLSFNLDITVENHG